MGVVVAMMKGLAGVLLALGLLASAAAPGRDGYYVGDMARQVLADGELVRRGEENAPPLVDGGSVPSSRWTILKSLLVLGAIGLLLWWAAQPRADFVITTSAAGVRFRGSLALAHQGLISQFFAQEFQPPRRLRVLGCRTRRDRRLYLRFRGMLSAGERQRIRNFLTSVLR
jgi:hypothetical protein